VQVFDQAQQFRHRRLAFGVTGVASSGNSGLVTTSGNNVLGTDPIVNSFIANQGFPVTLPGSALNRYNVNLPANPAAGQAGAIGLAILGSDFLIDLELSALQSEGRGEVISTPRVITANGKQALIEQGIQGAETFLGWFEDPESAPPNRLPDARVPRVLLQRGATGEAVVTLQSLMNRAGTMLIPDGDFGPGTERAVTHCQGWAGQPQLGVVDDALWTWLEALPEPFPPLPTEGVAFIAREETGGLAFYQDHTRWPHYPGEASGITIGLGYDLRMNTLADFKRDWVSVLPPSVFKVLALDIGKAGTKKRAKALKEVGIDIPFNLAWQVFTATTLPRYYDLTKSIYPSLDQLPPLCRAVLVSLVFNRGASLRGETRREMKAIQTLLSQADKALPDQQRWQAILVGVEDEIVAMKRLWSSGSGLVKRRQAEANLWRRGLEAG